jgi:hypothetical protein
MVIFYDEELLAPPPNPKLEDHPLLAVRDCIFLATLHIRRPFLHPQSEDAPCRGDRNPLIMVTVCNRILKQFVIQCSLSVARLHSQQYTCICDMWMLSQVSSIERTKSSCTSVLCCNVHCGCPVFSIKPFDLLRSDPQV